MKVPRLVLITGFILGMASAIFSEMAEAQSSSTLYDRIFDYHHQKMIRQRGGDPARVQSNPAWKNRKFKSGPNVTIAQIKENAPILMWNINRDNPGFNSLRVIGEANSGEQVRVSSFKEQGLRRVFFIKRGIQGWVKEGNLSIQ